MTKARAKIGRKIPAMTGYFLSFEISFNHLKLVKRDVYA